MYDRLKSILSNKESIQACICEERKIFVKSIMDEFKRCLYAKGCNGDSWEERLREIESEILNPTDDPYYQEIMFDDEIQVKMFSQFLSPDYNPPDDNIKLIAHVHSLWLYYSGLIPDMPVISEEVTSRIDFVALKILTLLKKKIVEFHVGEPRRDKTRKANQERMNNNAGQKKEFIEYYLKNKCQKNKSQLIRNYKKHLLSNIVDDRTIYYWIEEYERKEEQKKIPPMPLTWPEIE